MLIVDPRAGSRELIPIMKKRYRLPVVPMEMEFGDVAFAGNHARGKVQVGIEVKKLGDLLQCKSDGRLVAHQLPGLHRDYEEPWLLVIGDWSLSREGLVTVPRRRQWVVEPHQVMYCDLEAWLLTLQVKGGVRLARAKDIYAACRWLGVLHRWYAKRWDDHHSLNVFHEPAPDDRRLLVRKHPLVRRWAKELDGIDWTLSGRVEERFKTAEEMVAAEIPQWQGIPGIGKAKAQSAFAQIRERNHRFKEESNGREGGGRARGRGNGRGSGDRAGKARSRRISTRSRAAR